MTNPDALTPREIEVLQLVVLGYTTTEIAAEFFLSTRTIESHRRSIVFKTDCRTRAQLVAYANRRGFVKVELPEAA